MVAEVFRRPVNHNCGQSMDEISTKFFKAPAQDEILRIEFAEPGTLARKVISRSNTRLSAPIEYWPPVPIEF